MYNIANNDKGKKKQPILVYPEQYRNLKGKINSDITNLKGKEKKNLEEMKNMMDK